MLQGLERSEEQFRSCLDRRSGCQAMVRNQCKPSSQTELVLRKDIPKIVPQLALSKICGLHLRWPCTVVARRQKQGVVEEKSAKASESWIGMSSQP